MRESFNGMVVKYCSPVLAGIKTANMFTSFDTLSNIKNFVKAYNKVFNSFGIYFYILSSGKNNSLIYVYRLDRLMKDLKQKFVEEFMLKEGYNVYDIKSCIEILSYKIKSKKDFPHEIGLFLGYPIYDVLGFIENKGCNFKYCGFWKVYGNEENAKRIFCEYEQCIDLYRGRFNKDKNLLKLVTC